MAEAPPERVAFLRVCVYERVGKSVISLDIKKAQKGYQMHFMAVKKFSRCFSLVINSYS